MSTDDSGGPDRDPRTVLGESLGYLALVATRRLYDVQPSLWDLGEHGRARTLEDFTHHLKALASLDETTFRNHVDYCRRLFTERNLPLRWLDDAWRTIDAVVTDELPPSINAPALDLLRTVVPPPYPPTPPTAPP